MPPSTAANSVLFCRQLKQRSPLYILALQMCDFIFVCKCTYALWTYTHYNLFCQVGCQNLTGVSTSVLIFGVSCSCSFLRDDVQSKVNIKSESSLSHMQLALQKGPGHMLSVYTGMQSEDLLYSQWYSTLTASSLQPFLHPQHQGCQDSWVDKQRSTLRRKHVQWCGCV